LEPIPERPSLVLAQRIPRGAQILQPCFLHFILRPVDALTLATPRTLSTQFRKASATGIRLMLQLWSKTQPKTVRRLPAFARGPHRAASSPAAHTRDVSCDPLLRGTIHAWSLAGRACRQGFASTAPMHRAKRRATPARRTAKRYM